MKKIISVILSIMIILSFAMLFGCDNSTDDNPGVASSQPSPENSSNRDSGNGNEITEEMLRNSKPNEYVQEKLAAGIDVLVCLANRERNSMWIEISEGLKTNLEARGYKWADSECQDDMVKMVEQIENFLQMGAALIYADPADASAIRSTIEQVQDAGAWFMVYGTEAPFTNAMMIDTYEAAWRQAEMAAHWVSQRYPDAGEGEILVAGTGMPAVWECLLKTHAYEDFIEQDPRMTLVYWEDFIMDIDSGFRYAEEALLYEPGIRLFISFDIGGATGMSNYLVSQIDRGLVIDDYGVFAAGETSETRKMLSADYEYPSALRGTMLEGENTYQPSLDAILDILEGRVETPCAYWAPLFAVNNIGYVYDTRLQ